jgi:carboxyl-terminal processing protease
MREITPSSVMQKPAGVSMAVCLLIAVVVGVIGFAVGTQYRNLSTTISGGGLNYAELDNVYNELQNKYDGELDKTKLIQGAAAGLVTAAGDPYTAYFTAEEAREFSNDLSGTFTGVGIELGQNADKQLEVVSPLDDSPAKAAGIRARDVITAVNGENSLLWAPEKAVSKIRGEAGTTVKLTILRAGETKEYSITRAKITVPSVESSIENDIGYLRISRFGDDTSSLTAQAAQKFKDSNVRGVILDLRGNGGGYVDAARAVSSLWLKSGTTIVQEKRGDKVLATEKASGQAVLNGIKTVVLIDGGSASASEIVAGALKDNGAAELVGTKSYGKGSVQEMAPLTSGASLKVTIAKWYTPNGTNINKTGIEPDVKVEMTAEEYNGGNDTQRAKAVEILSQK